MVDSSKSEEAIRAMDLMSSTVLDCPDEVKLGYFHGENKIVFLQNKVKLTWLPAGSKHTKKHTTAFFFR